MESPCTSEDPKFKSGIFASFTLYTVEDRLSPLFRLWESKVFALELPLSLYFKGSFIVVGKLFDVIFLFQGSLKTFITTDIKDLILLVLSNAIGAFFLPSNS